MIEGKPNAIVRILHLVDGEDRKQETLFEVPDKKLFVIEAVGVNAFLQPNQDLMVTVVPALNAGVSTFPIVLYGEALNSEPELPCRKFGSQRILLYANTRIDITAFRSAANGKAQVEFNISGRLVDF